MITYLDRILSVPVSDPDDARRRKLLNILLAGIFFSTVLGLLVVLANIIVFKTLNLNEPEPRILIAIIGVFLLGTFFLYFINRYSGKIAATSFLLFITIAFSFSDTPEQLINGRSVFVYTIPIVVASLLLRPVASFIFAGLSGLIMAWLAYSESIQLNIPAIIGFSMLALISWLSSRTLEQALRELRIINAELDQRVVERTRELSESLAREAAQASQRQAILNSIADGVVVFDKNRTAIVANPSITSLTGKTQESILGQEITSLINSEELPADQRGRIREIFSQAGKVPTFRVNWGRKTLSVNAAEVRDANDQSMGTVAVFRDVSREAEVEKMKDTFLAVVSHELRTPLNAILGFAEMIKESIYGPVNEGQRKASIRIMDNTQRLLSIVSDLLDQAQIQSGRMKIKFVSCKPADLLTDLQETMEKLAQDKGIKLYTELDPSMPGSLNGDPQRLQQIMINLTNNAIKFSDQGEVRVSIRRQGEHNWQILVADTGEGIPQESVDYVFDTFRQVEGSATRKHGGVGLGLSIAKQLTELMSGNITVESRIGSGSIFTVTLPLNSPYAPGHDSLSKNIGMM